MTTQRTRILIATASAALASTFMSSAAYADCFAGFGAADHTITCDGSGGTGGFSNPLNLNGLTINVTSTGNVQTSSLNAGTGSGVNNQGTISQNINLGAGGTVNNASNATGNTPGASPTFSANGGIKGNGGSSSVITFGTTAGAQVNTFLNATTAAGLVGQVGNTGGGGVNVVSGGNTNFTNQGNFVGNLTQTGSAADVVNISNGSTFTVSHFQGNIVSAGSTTLNNSNGGVITGNITLGAGNDTITNTGVITGNVAMGAGTNVFNAVASGTSQLPSGTLTAASAGTDTSTLNLSGGSNDSVNIPVSGFNYVNKSGSGTWTIKQAVTLSAAPAGAPVQTNYNVTGGTLSVDNAGFLAGSNSILNSANVTFNGLAAGTYTGSMSGAGAVTIGTGTGATTFSGTNTYSGGTTIDTGTLFVTGGSALLDTGNVTIKNGGILGVSSSETIGGLFDAAGVGTNIVSIAAGQTLTVANGSFGLIAASQIQGAGGLTKTTGGLLTLSGANTFYGPLTINNGAVAILGGGAIKDTTAVVVTGTAAVGSTPAFNGELRVNASETIGSLASGGTAASTASVVIGTGNTLTTGGNAASTIFAGVISGPGALELNSTSSSTNFTLTGNNTYTGKTKVTQGILTGFAVSPANSSLQGDIAINSAGNLIFDQTVNPAGTVDGTYAGKISSITLNQGQYGKFNAGKLTMTGDNSGFSGQVNLGGGTLVIGSQNNLSAGTSLLQFSNNAILETTATFTLANPFQLGTGGGTFQVDPGVTTTASGAVSGSGLLTKTGVGTLVLGGTNIYSGGTLVAAGVIQGQAGTGIQGNIVNNSGSGITTPAGVQFTGTGIYAGSMSGTGGVEILNGTTTFSGINSYGNSVARTTVDAGATLQDTGLATSFSAVSSLLNNGIVNAFSNESVAALGGTGVLNLSAGKTFTIGNSGNYSYSGNINGNGGSLTSTGILGNTWVYSGTANGLNTFTNAAAATTTLASGAAVTATTTNNAGRLNINSGATLTSAVTNTGMTTVDGSVVGNFSNNASGSLYGTGTITGVLTNAGNVLPGHSPGVLSVNGAYVQTASGTYTADVYGSAAPVAGTDFDQIKVTGSPTPAGTASLAGNLVVVQNPATLYINGTQYDIITATNGITGSLAISGNVISPFVTLSNTVAGSGIVTTAGPAQAYRLIVVRSNYNTVALNPNQVAVAGAGLTPTTGLQGLVSVPAAASTVAKIDNMTAAQAQSLFDQASPEAYGAYATALQDQGELFTRQVAQRVSDTAEGKKIGIWINAYGQWGTGKADAYRFGSDQSITGFAAGIDGGSGNLKLGVAAGYSEDKVTYRLGNASGKDKSFQIGGYAAINAGKLGADLQLAYISGDITANKSINAGSGVSLITGTATAATKGNLFKAIGTVGYDMGSSSIAFHPYVGIDFTSGHINGFTEGGTTGVLQTTVNRIDAGKTDLMVGFKVSAKLGKITPYANVAYRYRLSSNSRNVTGYYNAIPSDAFTVSAITPSKSQGNVDAGLSFAAGKSASIFVGYQGTFRSDVTNHGVNGGVRVNF